MVMLGDVVQVLLYLHEFLFKCCAVTLTNWLIRSCASGRHLTNQPRPDNLLSAVLHGRSSPTHCQGRGRKDIEKEEYPEKETFLAGQKAGWTCDFCSGCPERRYGSETIILGTRSTPMLCNLATSMIYLIVAYFLGVIVVRWQFY